ncbi:hypothetical protein JCM3774_002564 [Rhodotorula dairenensis]
MAPTLRKEPSSTLQAAQPLPARPRRKATLPKVPSTSTSTRPKRRPPPQPTAPRKTAYKEKRGQTPAAPAIEASSDDSSTEADDDGHSAAETGTEEDNAGDAHPADKSSKRKAAVQGSETGKVTDSEADGGSGSDSSSTAVRNLLTPRKRQKRQRRTSDEEQTHATRTGTVVPETDYEGPGLVSSQRSVQNTYAHRKRLEKGKGKAVDPPPEPTPTPSPDRAQGAGPEDEEDSEEGGEEADGAEDEHVVAARRQPVASTSRRPSQQKAFANTPRRRSPAKNRVAADSREPPARPASPALVRNSARKRASQRRDPVQQHLSTSSSESEEGSTEERASPRHRRRFQLAPPEDGDFDEGDDRWNENETMYPPEIFQHRGILVTEDGARELGWVPDRFWVHDQWVSRGKRDQVVAFIEDNGGQVVRSMKKAQIAILPAWYSEGYRDLYAETLALGVAPVVYAWVQDCARKSAQQGRPVRLSRFNYTAPLPRRPADGRSKRYLRLSFDETEKLARLYARWLRREISRGEMLERMQNEFYDGTPRTTIDGFKACLEENERQIKSMAKRINRDAARQYTDSEPDGHGTDAVARTADEAYERMRRSRSRHRSASPRSADEAYRGTRKRRSQDRSASAERPDEPAELAALSTLALKHRRTPRLVQSIYLACAFDLEATRTVLDVLNEFDLGTIGLVPNSSSEEDRAEYARAVANARDQILNRVEVIWSPAQDRKLLQRRGPASDEKVARAKGVPLADLQERRDALEVIRGTGIESWYPDAEGFEQWTRELVDDDDNDDGDDASSELEPLA